MTFKTADYNDIPKLINMRIAFLEEDYGDIEEQNILALKTSLNEYFQKHLSNEVIAYAAFNDKEIVSTVFLLITEPPASPNFPTGKIGTILNVYTKPKYRRKGLAGELLKIAINDSKKMDLSYLDLQATEVGVNLYHKLGFADTNSKYVSMKYEFVN